MTNYFSGLEPSEMLFDRAEWVESIRKLAVVRVALDEPAQLALDEMVTLLLVLYQHVNIARNTGFAICGVTSTVLDREVANAVDEAIKHTTTGFEELMKEASLVPDEFPRGVE